MLPPKNYLAIRAVLVALLPSTALAYSGDDVGNGYISGYHGYGGSNCTACHAGSTYIASPTVTFSNCSSIPHGSTSTCTIGLNNSNAVRNGINMSVYQGAVEQSSGLITPADADLITTGASNEELSHETPQAANYKWDFDFNAPSSPTTDSYTLYFCINQVDGDGYGYNLSPGGADNGIQDGPAYCSTRTITITNAAPNAFDDSYTTKPGALDIDEGDTSFNFNVFTAGSGTADNDPESDTFTIASINTSGTVGNASINNATTGSITYDPNGQFNYLADGETTTDSFTYTIEDASSLSDSGSTATVTLRITGSNDLPTAVADSISVTEGGTVTQLVSTQTSVLFNDSDDDTSDSLTAVLDTDVTNGSLTLNSNGTFSYTHNGSQTSSDSFTYHANDGTGNSNTVTVSISISNTNDTPIAVADSIAVAEAGTATQLTTTQTSVLFNDSDEENDTLAAALVNNVSNGSLTLNSNGTFSYTHDGTETSSDSFTYRATANGGTSLSNEVTVSITVTNSNDSPVAVADSIYVTEGGTVTELTTTQTSVLFNDTDEENNSLTAVIDTSPTNASSFTLNTNGTFSYTHDGSETTTDSFTYHANDGNSDSNTITVSISIGALNDRPVANDDGPAAVTEVSSVIIDLLANDTDPENSSLSITNLEAGTAASNGSVVNNGDGTVTYTHNGSQTSSDSFTYTANDGTLDSLSAATVTVSVNNVNDSPIGIADSISVTEAGTATQLTTTQTSVLFNDTDEENNSLTASVVSNVSNGSLTLNSNGTFSYTHDGSETSSDSFTYQANDGNSNSSTTTVSISITNTNDSPVAVADSINVNEGGTATTLASGQSSVSFNDTDEENNSLTAVIDSSPTNASSFTLNTNGTFSYTHNGSETTSDSFTYHVNDGNSNSNIATVTINITGINESPSITSTAGTTAEEDSAYSYQITVSDPDTSDSSATDFTYSLSGEPTGMSVNSTGLITWTPPRTGTFNDVIGPITLTVADGGENSAAPDTEAFSITVNPPDGDGDLVPDYDDNCPSDGSSNDQTDTDNDGQGNLCDDDDDGDGIDDADEPGLGLDPLLTSTISIPADITMNSTGYLTAVDVGDGSLNEGGVDLTLDNDAATSYRPGHYTVNWSINNNIVGTQSISIIPLISFYPDQVITEGSNAQITVSINFDDIDDGPNDTNDITYPVSVEYAISGTTDASDHDLTNGTFTITAGNTSGTINVSTSNDAIIEGTETLILTLSNPINAAIGSQNTHTINITETNIAPVVNLTIQQNTQVVSTINNSLAGPIIFTASVSDTSGDTHSFDWSQTSNALTSNATVAPTSNSNSFTINDPTTLTAGIYTFSVTVSDGTEQTTATRLILVESTGVAKVDTDGDNIPDNVDSVTAPELLQDQTGNSSTTTFLQTESGLKLKAGQISIVANRKGALISSDDISDYGGTNGTTSTNATDTLDHISGKFDFEIHNVLPGNSVSVVLPLQTSLRRNAVYRKYNATDGWKEFVVDNNNAIASATGAKGVCPAPGSSEYQTGLTAFHYCIQLTIEDGGPNDADGVANGVILDPGVFALSSSNTNTQNNPCGNNPAVNSNCSTNSGSIGTTNPLLLFLSLMFLIGNRYFRAR